MAAVVVSGVMRRLGRKRGYEERHTGMRSEYFWRMRSASALRFSKGCSSLNLLRILGSWRDGGGI